MSGTRREDLRSAFDSDRDRIVFSPSFRRLQDKTQVFPLEPHDFVRTRLTHSLEVAALGRTIGFEIGRWLSENGEVDGPQAERDIPTLVETACLAHDLGNPPFGHSGEDAIRGWFREHIEAGELPELSEQERRDLLYFEGNAQGFRILTRLQRLHDDTGLNLTFPTLAAFTKYPVSSVQMREPWGEKFGYFASESATFAAVNDALELGGRRHPLAFLVEAADDVSYRIIDIEDAVRKKLLGVESVWSRIEPHLQEDERFAKTMHASRARFDQKGDDPDAERAFMHDMRMACTTTMFRACVEAFKARYAEILAGTFESSLLGASRAKELGKHLFQTAWKHAYTHESVLELELRGLATIRALLDRIVPACLAPPEQRKNTRTPEGKLYALLSRNQRYLFENYPTPGSPTYRALQLACDQVSGMTDSYALRAVTWCRA